MTYSSFPREEVFRKGRALQGAVGQEALGGPAVAGRIPWHRQRVTVWQVEGRCLVSLRRCCPLIECRGQSPL